MNKDIQQIKLFNPIYVNIKTYEWTEDINGQAPEKAYIELTSKGIKNGKVTNINQFRELLARKCARDLHKKMYTDDLKTGLFVVTELSENGYEELIYDCMKDIVKSTNRLDILDDKDTVRVNAMFNRNWFMDRLNLKYPIDMCNCYVCKESFWKNNTYIKKDMKNCSNCKVELLEINEGIVLCESCRNEEYSELLEIAK